MALFFCPSGRFPGQDNHKDNQERGTPFRRFCARPGRSEGHCVTDSRALLHTDYLSRRSAGKEKKVGAFVAPTFCPVLIPAFLMFSGAARCFLPPGYHSGRFAFVPSPHLPPAFLFLSILLRQFPGINCKRR